MVTYEEGKEIVPLKDPERPEDLDPITKKPREVEKKMWLVHLCVPLMLIQAEADESLPIDDQNEVKDDSSEVEEINPEEPENQAVEGK